MTCPWWSRWWHRRQRKIDALTVIQALVERAPPGKLLQALDLFWSLEGQEHWRCPCAAGDRQLYRDTFQEDAE
ncbi:MAG TPA: hypothetical protein VMR92_08510 [Gemmatimonadales bacterium]|nr:hypothetical protein [Gemmatimonadales bacterium]